MSSVAYIVMIKSGQLRENNLLKNLTHFVAAVECRHPWMFTIMINEKEKKKKNRIEYNTLFSNVLKIFKVEPTDSFISKADYFFSTLNNLQIYNKKKLTVFSLV